jgi:hypothetical protein
MDPYLVYWGGNRNLCASPVGGVCTAIDSSPSGYLENIRRNLGYVSSYASRMDLVKMTPQSSLASTGHCLAWVSAASAEYLVYQPNGGAFTVDLSGTSGAVSVEWMDPSTGTTTTSAAVSGGGTVQFSAPTSGDAVLYLKR